jgi:glucoamylase
VAVLGIGAILFYRLSSPVTTTIAPVANVPADHWTTGDKVAIGTAAGTTSNVWFTAVHGTLADVLYPTVDVDNLRQLDYLVTDGSTFLFDASTQGTSTARVTDGRALTFETTIDDPVHHFSVLTDYATDPSRPVVLVRTRLAGAVAGLHVYAYLVPHLGGSGAAQTAFFDGDRAFVTKQGTWLAIADDGAMGAHAAGFLGHGDGYDQLHHDVLSERYDRAGPGRVTLTWELVGPAPWTTVLAFGHDQPSASAAAMASLKRGWDSVSTAYRDGWRAYASGLTAPANAHPLFFYSAEVIKMAEDKLHPGAIVASLARPWGDTAPDDDGDVGYRKVWPRDLYHAASGLLAAGDAATAYDVLRFMGKQQQADGSMPQNTDLTGAPVWKGQQLDETADAILLAARLAGKASGPDVAKAAAYIVKNGPATQQERWEEASGYSPATIASEIAALRAAAGLVDAGLAATLRDTANRWDQLLESWTFVRSGPAGSDYYLRISPDGKPDSSEPIDLANGGGVWDQREIVDPSFLELVRLGVRQAGDPRITSTVKVVDATISRRDAGYPTWYRYPHDDTARPTRARPRRDRATAGRCSPASVGCTRSWPAMETRAFIAPSWRRWPGPLSSCRSRSGRTRARRPGQPGRWFGPTPSTSSSPRRSRPEPSTTAPVRVRRLSDTTTRSSPSTRS